METVIDKLTRLGACTEAVDWVRESGLTTMEELWISCRRGDWMRWLVGRAAYGAAYAAANAYDIADAAAAVAAADAAAVVAAYNAADAAYAVADVWRKHYSGKQAATLFASL